MVNIYVFGNVTLVMQYTAPMVKKSKLQNGMSEHPYI